jgi:hypothetical protein
VTLIKVIELYRKPSKERIIEITPIDIKITFAFFIFHTPNLEFRFISLYYRFLWGLGQDEKRWGFSETPE